MCDRCGELADSVSKGMGIGLNLTKDKLHDMIVEVFGYPTVSVFDATNWGFNDRVLSKLDPTAVTYTVLSDLSFPNPTVPYKDSVYAAVHGVVGGTNAHIFKWQGAKFLAIELRSSVAYDLCREFIFYEDGTVAAKLLKKIVRLNRSGKSIHIYGGHNVPLRNLANIPYVVPSEMWGKWQQFVAPQLNRKEVWNHVLFYGRPGCGKTAFCRWVATQYPKWKFIFVQPQSICKPGDISEIYEYAQRFAPVVLIFEDIDLIGQNRGDTSYNSTKGLGELLNTLDGVEPNQKILTIASTNNPAALDPAVTRAGRLGLPMTMSYTRDEKVQMLRKYYPFSKLTDEEIGSAVGLAAQDNAADLKMIAKVYQIYEEYENRTCNVDTLKAIARMITTQDKNKTYVPLPVSVSGTAANPAPRSRQDDSGGEEADE